MMVRERNRRVGGNVRWFMRPRCAGTVRPGSEFQWHPELVHRYACAASRPGGRLAPGRKKEAKRPGRGSASLNKGVEAWLVGPGVRSKSRLSGARNVTKEASLIVRTVLVTGCALFSACAGQKGGSGD